MTMIPLVVANEQGSVQAFNPQINLLDMWSICVTLAHHLAQIFMRLGVTEGNNPVQ